MTGYQSKRAMAQDKLAQPEQEPVAIVHIKDDCLVGSHRDNSKPFPDGQYGLWPIGTTPPQRTWVGLTEDEYNDIWRMDLNNRDLMDRTIEALKEKNNGT